MQKFLVRHRITEIEVKNTKIFTGNPKNITKAKIIGIRRFAKVLTIDLSNKKSLVIHIKLTGQLIYKGPNLQDGEILSKKVVGGVPGPHTHVIFHLDKGGFLYYNDVRRFGWIIFSKRKDVSEVHFIKKLGPEPLAA